MSVFRPPGSNDSPPIASGNSAEAESDTSTSARRRHPSKAVSTFACTQCTRTFNRRENLSRHMKAHDPLKAHRCGLCGKDFTRSDLLKRHVAGHERWDKKDAQTSRMQLNASAKRRRVTSGELAGPEQRVLSGPGSSRLTDLTDFGNDEENLDQTENSSNQTPGTQGNNGEDSDFASPYEVSGLQDRFSHQNTFTNEVEFSGQENFSNQLGYNHQGAPYYQNGSGHQLQLNHQPLGFQDVTNAGGAMLPYDFSSYLLPPDQGLMGTEWFSTEFYTAVRETGYEWDNLGQPLDQNLLSSWQNDDSPAVGNDEPTNDFQVNNLQETNQNHEEIPRTTDADPASSMNEMFVENRGGISRISSPPNEASEEDKWPFHWNPNSRPILNSKSIEIPSDHPLFQNHDSRFDISESTFLKMRAFLNPPVGREFHQSQKGKVTLPSLSVVNLFIGLFFENFSPQAPVVHHATVNTNADLPPPLLVAIVIIGAIYSHQRHTRRFAIVLLDILRWHLQIALECNNSLMQDPLIIYTEALICQAALWCGNKRAFVMAEIVRGTLVTHVRRADLLGVSKKHTAKELAVGSVKDTVQSQWKAWISEESQRRLYWVVYTIDSQFPSLLNLPATMSIGEIIDLGCPCDEEFWVASSARNWKNLLGPAQIPPSRAFSAAAGPFLLSTSHSASLRYSNLRWNRKDMDQKLQDRLPMLDLNPWSAFLVMMTIQNEVFKYSQEHLLARKFMDDDDYTLDEGDDESTEESMHSGIEVLKAQQAAHRDQLSRSLALWSKAYIITSPRSTSTPTSKHFYSAAVVLYHLATILLDVSLTDLQNAIGKDGNSGIPQAIMNLTKWATENPQKAEMVAHNATKTIVSLTLKQARLEDDAHLIDTIPYNLITIFLCHVVLWAFTSVAPASLKDHLLQTLHTDDLIHSSPFFATLKRGLSPQDENSQHPGGLRKTDFQRNLFKSAAEMLTQFATWGAALNLALLLHNRAEM